MTGRRHDVGSPARRTWTLATLDRRTLHALWFDIETRRWESVPWPGAPSADDHAAAGSTDDDQGRASEAADWAATALRAPPLDEDWWLAVLEQGPLFDLDDDGDSGVCW